MNGIGPWHWGEVLTFLTWFSFVLVLCVLAYTAVLVVLSRRAPRRAEPETRSVRSDWTVVFVLPCLNEGRVLGASIDRLLTLDDGAIVLVVDDGSDDDTADIVGSYDTQRVQVLSRVAPHARQGKGEAINAAFAHLVTSPLLAGRDPRRVIVAILDADGRLEPHTLADVLPFFDRDRVGGVQIGVRINNRHSSFLARLQDIEFVVFTEVFQRARRHLGSVGMGGNGQFMRLSALMSLGPKPWSRSLTEDLDLGVRLILAGWQTDYCHTAAVHQQGVVEWGRLVRQRTRWFQGHLQSWALLGEVTRMRNGITRRDLQYHLTSPLLILLASLLTASFLIGCVGLIVLALLGTPMTGWWMLGVYALSVGPALVFSQIYVTREPGMSRLRAALLAHAYVGYCLMWYLAGWRATWRLFVGDDSWAKTARQVETDETTLAPDTAPAPVPDSVEAAEPTRHAIPTAVSAVADTVPTTSAHVARRTGIHRARTHRHVRRTS
ncbi:MAG: glycosyltransferase family 2 protein [Mobilicoccus sp.]|nr:glycosyltransferase family 2 protein [Mobilicoccus sp.]